MRISKEILIKIYQKYKEIILYIFFGGITTFINIVSYYLFYNILNVSNVISNIIAWFLSVIFAFVTNKIWVFNSKSWEIKITIKELVSFISVRLLTGVFDTVVMYLGVDVFKFNSLIMKIVSNLIVLISNYIGSKLFIFKKK
ncbi:GtrA family protein [Helcococcus ovis]|uniref:GtrA family protein n=2 Tax=Helcococcus ovis TaxID=72026 RepID=A0A4R9C488_9FIRM|nr:GtrA family protein [Helcococcus ovis]TFF65176.1 GtrA family protein [Helcococcus ovis]TFF66294.1 GtrA family protein [Helcococcus ovis]TFF67768.1 GtrA family protein [Helcococcus ovis]WNZ01374.1 GtrA family protein [Helcococcus ovis]